MKRKQRWILLIGLLGLAGVVVWGYFSFSGGRTHSTDLNGLRAQFNQDKGKVRLLMVLSPT